jgi:hypothetical protein
MKRKPQVFHIHLLQEIFQMNSTTHVHKHSETVSAVSLFLLYRIMIHEAAWEYFYEKPEIVCDFDTIFHYCALIYTICLYLYI